MSLTATETECAGTFGKANVCRDECGRFAKCPHTTSKRHSPYDQLTVQLLELLGRNNQVAPVVVNMPIVSHEHDTTAKVSKVSAETEAGAAPEKVAPPGPSLADVFSSALDKATAQPPQPTQSADIATLQAQYDQCRAEKEELGRQFDRLKRLYDEAIARADTNERLATECSDLLEKCRAGDEVEPAEPAVKPAAGRKTLSETERLRLPTTERARAGCKRIIANKLELLYPEAAKRSFLDSYDTYVNVEYAKIPTGLPAETGKRASKLACITAARNAILDTNRTRGADISDAQAAAINAAYQEMTDKKDDEGEYWEG